MNKIALVTGGARGLGEQIVRSFLDKDYKVVINFYKSEKKAKKLSDEFGENVLIVQADISQNKDIKNMMIEINEYFNDYPSILINNALAEYVFNGDLRTHAEDISWKEISNQLDVTLKGSIEVLQALIPSMKKRKFGRVINIGTNPVSYTHLTLPTK